jgi:U32 family peptidase
VPITGTARPLFKPAPNLSLAPFARAAEACAIHLCWLFDMKPSLLELLAPVGSLETFTAAVDAGADAVYIGAPAANARALARDFTPAELAAMIAYAHEREVRVYAAMNSLLKEDELVRAAATVELLAGLGVDALIIQDLGLYELCRRFFPKLRLHASTLLGAHNSLAVRQFAAMGFARVVLARELTLAEIAAIRRETEVELEVFVHGAMCFSYSGLCLFSSYLGGKSGLRGRCVQPCRRAYRWRAKAGTDKSAYLFSMNDLEALELLPDLRRAGVGSVKIEGRMRSALYVDRVIRAYRLVIDAMEGLAGAGGSGAVDEDRSAAAPSPRWAAALGEGRALLAEALGRRTGSGFLQRPFKELVSPGHSGNIGLFLGKIRAGRDQWGVITLRHPLRKGDRLRLHSEPSGDRLAFTAKEIRALKGQRSTQRGGRGSGPPAGAALAGETIPAGGEVEILLPAAARPGDSLYKVDLAGRRGEKRRQLVVAEPHRRRAAALEKQPLRREIMTFLGPVAVAGDRGGDGGGRSKSARRPRSEGKTVEPARAEGHNLPLWLRLDDPRLLPQRLPPEVMQVVLPLTPESWPRFAAAGRLWRRLADRLIWALPPIILEQDLAFYREKIAELRAQGCHAWQIGHLGQLLLFTAAESGASNRAPHRGLRDKGRSPRSGLTLYGDYTLNILNSLARESCRRFGLVAVQAAIETDRQSLALLARARRGPLGLTIYGRPPLFTSRLDSVHFRYQVPLFSPRGEGFVLARDFGQTLALAERPFSLLPYSEELAASGLAYGVIDLRWQKIGRQELPPLLRQVGKGRRRSGLSAFNYLGGLD